MKKSNKLQDVVQLIRGTTYKSALLGTKGPVLLGLGSIQRNGGFRDDSLKNYGGESRPNMLLRPGDMYVSLKDVTQSGDLLGAVARVPEHVRLGRLTQDTVKLDIVDFEYPRALLYWSLRAPQYRAYCREHATGTTNLGLAREDFLSFDLPEATPDRVSLAMLLESIESEIGILHGINETLESMAQAIFKSWFVDFDPVLAKAEGRQPERIDAATADMFPNSLEDSAIGRIPKGWTVGMLGDLADVSRRQVQPNAISEDTFYVGLEHIPRKTLGLDSWGSAAGLGSAKSCFEKGDILFGKLRPYFHKVVVAPFSGVCSTDVIVCNSKSHDYYGFVVMQLFSCELVAFADKLSNGAKMPRSSWKDLAGYFLAKPPAELARAFSDTVKPMLDQIVTNIHQANSLCQLRDSLLPKLIPGELRFPEAESIVRSAVNA